MTQLTGLCLHSRELKDEFYQQYADMVRRQAMELTGNERMADDLTACVFAAANQRFEQQPLPANCRMYLLAQTNLLYARNPARFTPAPPVAVPRPVSAVVAAAPPEPAEKTTNLRSALRPAKTVGWAAVSPRVKGTIVYTPNEEEDPQARASESRTARSRRTSRLRQRLLEEETRRAALAATAAEETALPETEPIFSASRVAAPPAPSPVPVQPQPSSPAPWTEPVPAPRTEPVIAAAAKTSAQPSQPAASAEAAPQAGAVYDAGMTMMWTPETKEDPEEEKRRYVRPPDPPESARSVPLTVINTILFLLSIAAAGFLLLELGWLPKLW